MGGETLPALKYEKCEVVRLDKGKVSCVSARTLRRVRILCALYLSNSTLRLDKGKVACCGARTQRDMCAVCRLGYGKESRLGNKCSSICGRAQPLTPPQQPPFLPSNLPPSLSLDVCLPRACFVFPRDFPLHAGVSCRTSRLAATHTNGRLRWWRVRRAAATTNTTNTTNTHNTTNINNAYKWQIALVAGAASAAFIALCSGLVCMYLRNRKIYREYNVLKEQNEAELELDRIGGFSLDEDGDM